MMSEPFENPLGGLCHCDATNAWDCACIQDDDARSDLCPCCGSPGGEDGYYCEPCFMGDCPRCV